MFYYGVCKMNTIIIVQARMTSTRLPGKVLKKVLDKPLLEYQIERLQRVKLARSIVIATTTNDTDQPIVDLCTKLNVPFFRGSELDVLARYHGAAMTYRADVVVRVTSDCPLIDPQVIDKVIKFYLDHYPEYDYVSNTLERSYPRGMDTEIFSIQVLDEIFREASAQPDREHVTPFIYRHPERYNLANVSCAVDYSNHRWTVDTPEDFELVSNIISALYPANRFFNMQDCLDLLNKNPEWVKINSHVQQKVYCQ